MGLEEVKNEIVQQAKAEADRIISTAEAEAEDINKKAREEVKAYEENAKAHNVSLFERTEKKMIAAAQFDGQRKILSTKQGAIDAVLNSVKESIVTMKAPARKKFLSMLLTSAKKEISIERIFVNKKDLKTLSGVTSKPIDINAGLIAENKDATISVDLSIKTLLEEVRGTHLVKLNEVLFQ